MKTSNLLDADDTSAGAPLLPFEILALIASDAELRAGDFCALRLTSRAFNRAATERLFHRIHISKLVADRDSFLAICASPHLAVHVREVVWLEIGWNTHLFEANPSPVLGYLRHAWPDSTDEALCAYFNGQTSASFWLPNLQVPLPDTVLAGKKALEDFRGVFLAAIDSLPNLHTFTSEPMPSARIINPGQEYEMSASLFQTVRARPGLAGDTVQANDGLFLFLAEAMCRPTSTVTRLRCADEFPGKSLTRGLDPSTFERLESVELCLIPGAPIFIHDGAFADLAAALARAAPTLRHLKLCLDHGRLGRVSGTLERSVLLDAFKASPGQSALQSLSLVGVPLPTDELLAAITSHAGTLRHVYLESMTVELRFIKLLQDASQQLGLNLETIRVVNDEPREDSEHFHFVCEHALLRYINPGRGKRSQCQHPLTIPQGEHCDVHLRLLADNESSWSGTVANSNYSAGAWSDASEPEDEPEWHATFATEANWGECESEFGSDDDILSDVTEEFPPGSMDYRTQPGWPKWAWNHFPSEDGSSSFYMFQVPDGFPDACPTEIWRFTSRTGDVVYGHDPLLWFDEWDTEAGDVAEATPYGRISGECMASEFLELGAVLEPPGPPKGAIRYCAEEDPRRNLWWLDY